MNIRSKIAVDERDVALLAAIEEGLPICAAPYAEVGAQLQMTETDVIERLTQMRENGIIRRFGLVLHHHSLGYRANAMVVWNVPDADVDKVAREITKHDFVTLCYSRTRQEPEWPFNLYCMIHGRQRSRVETQISLLKKSADLLPYASQTLFSLRRFKQTGARFSPVTSTESARR